MNQMDLKSDFYKTNRVNRMESEYGEITTRRRQLTGKNRNDI
jgi:hypothetical protein